jgi:DNA-binding protein HU-beta
MASKMETVSSSDLVRKIAEKLDIPMSTVKSVLDAEQEVCAELMKDGKKVSALGGGLLMNTRVRAGRTGRNPRTGEPVEIAPATVIKAKATAKFTGKSS